ncbi:MAG: MarR family winged helix-turn-helix transcriptional regulator [Chloroflexota bacterium]
METPLLETLYEWMRIVMRYSMRHLALFARQKNTSMAQINALMRISHKGECGVTHLGEELGVTSAAASQLLEKLVQQGLVERSEDPQDRRNKRVILTEAGMRMVQESIQARQGWLVELVELLSPSEQEFIQQALQILIQKASQLSEVKADTENEFRSGTLQKEKL